MGIMRDDLYAVVGNKIVSVHRRTKFDMNLLSMRGGDSFYDLRVDGEVVDSYEHGTSFKGSSMFAILPGEGQRTSVRIDVMSRSFRIIYKLIVNDVETTLTQSSEAEIKALWHKKHLSQ